MSASSTISEMNKAMEGTVGSPLDALMAAVKDVKTQATKLETQFDKLEFEGKMRTRRYASSERDATSPPSARPTSPPPMTDDGYGGKCPYIGAVQARRMSMAIYRTSMI